MTDEDRAEIERAIKVARSVHDRSDGPADGTVVILGALIRAVELLACERDQSEPPKLVRAFNDGIVERLRKTYQVAYDAQPDQQPGEYSAACVARCHDAGIRAILSELAAMPVELDSNDLFDELLKAYAHGTSGVSDGRGIIVQREVLRARLAPILAAKDAAIEMHRRAAEYYKRSFDGKAARVAELESGQHEDTQRLAAALQRVAELEKRLAEQNAPVDATGKTPGQVWDEAYGAAVRRAGLVRYADWNTTDEAARAMGEEAAQAVIRAFGQNTADALRRVRDKINRNYDGSVVESILETIDFEIKQFGWLYHKTKYASEKEALDIAESFGKKFRAYRCHAHDCWHLTSSKKR